MDRLGDLNLINASAVCSRERVPFCQDIRPILQWGYVSWNATGTESREIATIFPIREKRALSFPLSRKFIEEISKRNFLEEERAQIEREIAVGKVNRANEIEIEIKNSTLNRNYSLTVLFFFLFSQVTYNNIFTFKQS